MTTERGDLQKIERQMADADAIAEHDYDISGRLLVGFLDLFQDEHFGPASCEEHVRELIYEALAIGRREGRSLGLADAKDYAGELQTELTQAREELAYLTTQPPAVPTPNDICASLQRFFSKLDDDDKRTLNWMMAARAYAVNQKNVGELQQANSVIEKLQEHTIHNKNCAFERTREELLDLCDSYKDVNFLHPGNFEDIKRLATALRSLLTQPVEVPSYFVIKHYLSDDYPTIKYPGGEIQVVGDRQDAEDFIRAVSLAPKVEQGVGIVLPDAQYAIDCARTYRSFLKAFIGQRFEDDFSNIDRRNLGVALDHLQEAAALLLNAVSTPPPKEPSLDKEKCNCLNPTITHCLELAGCREVSYIAMRMKEAEVDKADVNAVLQFVSNDSIAITYQSIGQYRKAILELLATPSPTAHKGTDKEVG